MNIAFYPGSFNPVHLGHIRLAEYIRHNTETEEVWMSVSPNNPLKPQQDLADEELRYTWLQAALQDREGLQPCNIELSLPRPSYTVVTLRTLAAQYPEHCFSLVMGADNLAVFEHWKDWQEILNNYPLLVYPRKGTDLQTLRQHYPQVIFLPDAPLFPISSTEIRQCLHNGQDITDRLPAPLSTGMLSEVYSNKGFV